MYILLGYTYSFSLGYIRLVPSNQELVDTILGLTPITLVSPPPEQVLSCILWQALGERVRQVKSGIHPSDKHLIRRHCPPARVISQ